jgi:selenocysteine lyase/cysteine desulfurase
LGAGVRSVLDVGVSSIRAHEHELTRMLIDGLCAIPGITFYGPRETANRVSTISFTVANKRVSEIGLRLDEEHGVLCRVGLHCAPAAHRTIGSFPEGTIRFAPGMWTTANDIRTAIHAVEQVVRE